MNNVSEKLSVCDAIFSNSELDEDTKCDLLWSLGLVTDAIELGFDLPETTTVESFSTFVEGIRNADWKKLGRF